MSVDELRAAFDAVSSTQGELLVLPGTDESVDPDGKVVLDGRGPGWAVYTYSRGPQGHRRFATEAEAIDFAYRRHVLLDEDA